MKFKIEKRELLNLLETPNQATKKSNTDMLICEGININLFQNGYVIITGTDNTLTSQKKSSAPVEFDEVGNIVVDSKLFVQIIKTLPEGIVSLETSSDTGTLKIECQKSLFNVNYVNGDEFPKLETGDALGSFTVNTNEFIEAVSSVIFAASKEETRPALQGVLIELTELNKATIVALDGYRLAMNKVNVDSTVSDKKILINSNDLDRVLRCLKGAKEVVKATLTNNHLLFEDTETRVAARLMNTDYVDYQSLISNSSNLENAYMAKKKEIETAIERASIMCSSDTKLTKISLCHGTTTVESRSNVGNVKEDVEIEANTEQAVSLGFNSRYILDAIKSFATEEIILHANDSHKPCVIKAEGSELFQLVLPVRLVA